MRVFTAVYLMPEVEQCFPAPQNHMPSPRTPLEIYSDALQTLEADNSPMTAEKSELMRYLRARITR